MSPELRLHCLADGGRVVPGYGAPGVIIVDRMPGTETEEICDFGLPDP